MIGLLLLLVSLICGALASCNALDAKLALQHNTVCASIASPSAPWCKPSSAAPPVKPSDVHHDWPKQTGYFVDLIDTLESVVVSSSQCNDTDTVRSVVEWLDGPMANMSIGGSYMNTYGVFQVYFSSDLLDYTK